MGKFNKMINFVKSSYKKTTKRINHIGAVTEPSCGPDKLGVISTFTILAILIISSIFIEDALIKLSSILCLVFVIYFILKDYGQE